MIFNHYFSFQLPKHVIHLGQENYLSVLCIFLFLQTACTENPLKPFQLQGSTMGTFYHITVIADKNTFNAKQAQLNIEQELKKINQQMSTYLPSSEISKFNKTTNKNWFSVSKSFAHVVYQSMKISQITNGSFDITTGSLVNLWGFGASYKNIIPSQHEIHRVLQQTGYHLLDVCLNPPALKKQNTALTIDLSAIAKGYAVDRISEKLLKQGFINHLVEIGGELKASGINFNKQPWSIGINIPDKSYNTSNKVYKKPLLLNNEAVATSGDYQNYFEKKGTRYSHTIDPATGKPVTHKLASVTVVSKSSMHADAFATALMVMGEVKGKQFVQKENLKVFMLIRNNEGKFDTWNTIESFEKNDN